jgi:hypothetical protein
MIKLIITLCLAFLLVGCSKAGHPVVSSEKARLVREQVLDIPKCLDFRIKLLLPNISAVEIDNIYQDATQLGCINKDL